MSPREHAVRVQDILDRIDRIIFAENYLKEIEGNPSVLSENPNISTMVLDSILYCLLVIGEAVKSLNPEMKLRSGYVPWHEIVGLRNLLAHQYFNTEAGMIKSIINLPLTQLKEVCEYEAECQEF